MKITILPALFLLLATAWAGAVEPAKLPLEVGTLTLVGGKVYEGVTITGQDAVGVKITHAGGTARVPFEKLPGILAVRFPRGNAAEAQKQKEAEAKAEEAHRRATPDKKDSADEGAEDAEAGDDSPLEKAPETTGDNTAKIAALEGYVQRLENGIRAAREKAADLRRRAGEMRSEAYTTVTIVDSNGRTTTVQRDNKSKINRAKTYERQAQREDDKIHQAQLLITDSRSRIADLRAEDRENKK